MNEVRVKPVPRRDGLLNPRTLVGTVLVFAVGYAVWQPLFRVLMHLIWGNPLPFATSREWALFAGVAAGIGVFAGAAWYHVQRMRPSRWREFGDMSLRMVALCMTMPGFRFAPSRAGAWLAELLLVAAMMGALFGPGISALVGRDPSAEPPST